MITEMGNRVIHVPESVASAIFNIDDNDVAGATIKAVLERVFPDPAQTELSWEGIPSTIIALSNLIKLTTDVVNLASCTVSESCEENDIPGPTK